MKKTKKNLKQKKINFFKNTIQQYSQISPRHTCFRGGDHQKQDMWERKELNSLCYLELLELNSIPNIKSVLKFRIF